MALGLNKIILANATTNAAGAYFSNTTVTATNAGAVIPAGTYLVFPTANVVITANNGSTISTLLANNTGGMLLSDGVNVFAQSTIAGNGTVTLLTVNGGVNVSGTYNT
jgi:hypothetical protein